MEASVIINYCSNEKYFIDAMLTECLKFSTDVVVSYGSHLYDGTPEDTDHINSLVIKYPSVRFVCYTVDKAENLYLKKGVVHRPTAYWHNLARWTGAQALQQKEWVFILDSDEIPEGDKVRQWLNQVVLDKRYCYKLMNYWYFKYPTNQAITYEDSILLIHYEFLTENNIFGDWERDHLISASGCRLMRHLLGLDSTPMFHHFSFVRSKSGLQHKLKHWAHNSDAFKNVNVDQMIEYIYHNDEVNDIVHNYKYNKVLNKFNIVL